MRSVSYLIGIQKQTDKYITNDPFRSLDFPENTCSHFSPKKVGVLIFERGYLDNGDCWELWSLWQNLSIIKYESIIKPEYH